MAREADVSVRRCFFRLPTESKASSSHRCQHLFDLSPAEPLVTFREVPRTIKACPRGSPGVPVRVRHDSAQRSAARCYRLEAEL